MKPRNLNLIGLSIIFAATGYFFFGIVVSINAGLWLYGEKMYFAQGLSAHFFGSVGAIVGVVFAWLIWRLGMRILNRI